ncbi:helix-turn-helix transcriptional regulator [Lentzea sp. NPDC051838]|uniref:helix-turn-helix transcriptional regulator n=1 Tax=Lentzea sp. NPDC051838 TaxID=3154849 RepID=UPI003447AA74
MTTDTDAQPPLVRRHRVHLTDVEETSATLARQISNHSLTIRPDLHDPSCSITINATSGFTYCHTRLGWHGVIDGEPTRSLRLVEITGGRMVFLGTGSRRPLPVGSQTAVPAGIPLHVDFANIAYWRVEITPDQISEALGHPADAADPTYRFAFGPASTPLRNQYWTAVRRHVFEDVLNNPEAANSPLCLAEAARLLAVGAVFAFPNNALEAGPQPSGPPSLRRAVAYIEDHAREPITLADIAAAARVGPRDLQSIFRRHLDTSPILYLRRVRLAHVHDEIKARTGSSITSIARNWGFTDMSRFAAYYREEYGCSPRDTSAR